MAKDSQEDDFGDIVPQAVVDAPNAVQDYLTHGADSADWQTRIAPAPQTRSDD